MLARRLNLGLLTLYGVGTILGAGIYVLIGEVAARAGPGAPVSFLVAGVLAALTGLSFAELSARYPRSAGEAIYVQEAFAVQWLSTLLGLLVAFTGVVSAATIVVGFHGYLSVFVSVPTLEHEQPRAEAWWRERLANEATTLLAVLDRSDAGLCVVARSFDDPNVAGLYAVWVAPLARGHGVGDALVEAAVQTARERGHRRIVLDVGDHNEPAIALYARFGFEPTGRTSTLPPPRAHITEHERAREV